MIARPRRSVDAPQSPELPLAEMLGWAVGLTAALIWILLCLWLGVLLALAWPLVPARWWHWLEEQTPFAP
jgi:hypothetical protein